MTHKTAGLHETGHRVVAGPLSVVLGRLVRLDGRDVLKACHVRLEARVLVQAAWGHQRGLESRRKQPPHRQPST